MLKPQCLAALRRIFKLCDVGKDGVLDAAELNDFQVRVHPQSFLAQLCETVSRVPCSTRFFHPFKRKCFSSPLQLQEIEGIFRTLSAQDPLNVSLDPPGITEQGEPHAGLRTRPNRIFACFHPI